MFPRSHMNYGQIKISLNFEIPLIIWFRVTKIYLPFAPSHRLTLKSVVFICRIFLAAHKIILKLFSQFIYISESHTNFSYKNNYKYL